MYKKIKVLGVLFLITPLIGLASGVGNLEGVIAKVKSLLSSVLPLILTLAVFYFLWALTNYMLKAGDNKDEARQQMLWGVIILFVMVSVWGLVNILSGTLFG